MAHTHALFCALQQTKPVCRSSKSLCAPCEYDFLFSLPASGYCPLRPSPSSGDHSRSRPRSGVPDISLLGASIFHHWRVMAVVDEGRGEAAIKRALRALRKRHFLEEGAHAPAFLALSRPLLSQSSEWKEKAETLELELQQCYKAQARLSEQLVVEVAESRTSKALVQEKDEKISHLETEIEQAREECSKLNEVLHEKTEALDLVMSENQALQLEDVSLKVKTLEAENKMLVDRWMLQKMQDAERLNESNALYEDMMLQLKASSIEQLARQQVDGVIRQSEIGAEYYSHSPVPSSCKHRIHAHEGGCGSILFEYNSDRLISGGQDQVIKIWDTNSGLQSHSLHGCLGSVLDITITHENRNIIAASSSNNLYVWEVGSGRIRHTLTGHTQKVCAVDASKISSRHVVSGANDRTIKVWDLQKGYCINTLMSYSHCNSVCFGMDEQTICSGHLDGNLRLWDVNSGKLISEVGPHSCAITSVCLSRNGNFVLVSGKDNTHNLFDMRTLEVCGTMGASGNKVYTNWSRSCLSPDDNYVASGSSDGSVYIWSRSGGNIVSTLKGDSAPVLTCSWSELGKALVAADKNGALYIWK